MIQSAIHGISSSGRAFQQWRQSQFFLLTKLSSSIIYFMRLNVSPNLECFGHVIRLIAMFRSILLPDIRPACDGNSAETRPKFWLFPLGHTELNDAFTTHVVFGGSRNESIFSARSGFDETRRFAVIKPSGVDYEKLTPAMLVVKDLEGHKMQTGQPGDELNPSVDSAHHLHLDRHGSDIGGIVHIHSKDCFTLLERPLPAHISAIADLFGAEIPCSPYVDNIGEHIGQKIVQNRNRAPAIFLDHHGVFIFGQTPQCALQAVVMLEDACKTCYSVLLLGEPRTLSWTRCRSNTNAIIPPMDNVLHRKGRHHGIRTATYPAL